MSEWRMERLTGWSSEKPGNVTRPFTLVAKGKEDDISGLQEVTINLLLIARDVRNAVNNI